MADPQGPRTPDDPLAVLPRREFLQMIGAGTGALMAGGCAASPMNTTAAPGIIHRGSGHVIVIGAGAWGSWTAWSLRQRGIRVTLIDAYGAGNSKSTSGDETRGIRSSYGDRASGEHWTRWARQAISRWQQFDAEWGPVFRTRFFIPTGDVIMRAANEPFLTRTRQFWTALGVTHEVIDGTEVRKRWPVINADDTTIAITEPDAGVARARASTQAVAALAEKAGAARVLGRVRLGPIRNGQLDGVVLDDGTVIRGDAYVFACGPWLRKLFPEIFGQRMRLPLGHVCYFGTPEGDTRFQAPNLPSFNFPGVTGWAALPVDNRGFRVRGSLAPTPVPGAPPPPAQPFPPPPADPAQEDPDISSRWSNEERVEGTRRFVRRRFPLLANAPLLETRACHYEITVNRDFIVDRLPDTRNAWIAGAGQAEGFKFSPIIGDYIAGRVLGDDGDPKLVAAFKLPTETYESPSPRDAEDAP